MPFVATELLSSGKPIDRVPALCALDKPFCSTPPVDGVPPQQPQPFVKTSLGPLTLSPPACSKLRVVTNRCNREGLLRQLVPKNAERAAGVEIRCDDQNPGTFFSCQAFCRVVRFLASRE